MWLRWEDHKINLEGTGQGIILLIGDFHDHDELISKKVSKKKNELVVQTHEFKSKVRRSQSHLISSNTFSYL